MAQEISARPLSLLRQPEFIRDHVWPVFAGGTGAPAAMPGDWELKVAQLLGTERVTVEYRLGDGRSLFAKLYADEADGLASYGVLRALWEQGFGADARYRVAEPLGYLAEYRLLLMPAAPGECLLALRARGWETWEEGLRDAARWLAALHSSPIRQGPLEDVRQGVFRLASRLAKAAARHPEQEARLIALVKELGERAGRIAGPRSRVQTHGRYHAGHLFLAPDSVTVIDLDRSCPADPAKDVAEFLHRLRSEAGKGQVDEATADRSTAVFLEEYTRHSPESLSGLAYYWSYSILSTLLHSMRKRHLDRAIWEERLDFYQAEFADIPRRVAG